MSSPKRGVNWVSLFVRPHPPSPIDLCYQVPTQALTMSLQAGATYYLRNVPSSNVLDFNYGDQKVSVRLTCTIFGPLTLLSTLSESFRRRNTLNSS